MDGQTSCPVSEPRQTLTAQMCSTCTETVVETSVPGYTQGAPCYGCVKEALPGKLPQARGLAVAGDTTPTTSSLAPRSTQDQTSERNVMTTEWSYSATDPEDTVKTRPPVATPVYVTAAAEKTTSKVAYGAWLVVVLLTLLVAW